MTGQPLREDFSVYDLTADKVVEGPWAPVLQAAAAEIARQDAETDGGFVRQKKKPGRKPGSKNKPKKTRKAKAPPVTPPVEPVPETKTPIMSLRVAAGGEGMLNRVRRITADQWVWILIPVAAIALAVALAFLTGVVKL